MAVLLPLQKEQRLDLMLMLVAYNQGVKIMIILIGLAETL